MATYAHVTILSNKKPAKKIFEETFKRMQDIENLMSDYRKNSDVTMINENVGEGPIPVSDETLYVVKKAIKVSKETEGAFDITIRPLMELWGFKEKISNKIPSDFEIKEVLEKIGWQKIKILNNSIELEEGMKIDLGGIAKGYAVDQAIELLKKNGIKNAIIEIGGDLYCLGEGPQAKGWIIGIQHPKEFNKILGKLKIKNRAVATSGNYENFRIINGEEYSHIIDPRNGKPIRNRLLSVTVIASNCLLADAWATALFVMGEKKGMEMVNKNSSLEAIFVEKGEDGKLKLKISEGAKKIFEKWN
jgi:thiamine biosynthesis lipoprotein